MIERNVATNLKSTLSEEFKFLKGGVSAPQKPGARIFSLSDPYLFLGINTN